MRATLNCSKQGGAEHCFLTCPSQVNISTGECTRHSSRFRLTLIHTFTRLAVLSRQWRLSLWYVAYAGAEDSYTVTCGLPLPGSSGGGPWGDGGPHCSGKFTHAPVYSLASVGLLLHGNVDMRNNIYNQEVLETSTGFLDISFIPLKDVVYW